MKTFAKSLITCLPFRVFLTVIETKKFILSLYQIYEVRFSTNEQVKSA
jgi:hypothetical protein